MPEHTAGTLTFPVQLTVGRYVYTLGAVCGASAEEVVDSLADLLVEAATMFRTPNQSGGCRVHGTRCTAVAEVAERIPAGRRA